MASAEEVEVEEDEVRGAGMLMWSGCFSGEEEGEEEVWRMICAADPVRCTLMWMFVVAEGGYFARREEMVVRNQVRLGASRVARMTRREEGLGVLEDDGVASSIVVDLGSEGLLTWVWGVWER